MPPTWRASASTPIATSTYGRAPSGRSATATSERRSPSTVHHPTQDPAELDRLLAPYREGVRNEPDLQPAFAGQPLIVAGVTVVNLLRHAGDLDHWRAFAHQARDLDDRAHVRSQDWGYGDAPADGAAFRPRLTPVG